MQLRQIRAITLAKPVMARQTNRLVYEHQAKQWHCVTRVKSNFDVAPFVQLCIRNRTQRRGDTPSILVIANSRLSCEDRQLLALRIAEQESDWSPLLMAPL